MCRNFIASKNKNYISMKVILRITVTIILCLSLNVNAQSYIQDSVWFVNNYDKTEINIVMRDGVKLFTSIYAPKNKTDKSPILMTRTPYSCRPYGAAYGKLWATHYINYAKENYIFVTQDVRGRWMSEGTFVDVRPFNKNKKLKTEIDEASDTYDAIDWLVKNTNCNGNVGILGTSYPGFYANMAALSNHPALKAVSPQAPVTDWFVGDDFHHNGAFAFMDAFDFYTSFGRPRPKPTTIGFQDFDYKNNDNYDFFLKAGSLKSLKQKYMGDSLKFINDLYAHPNLDEFWKVRNTRENMYNVKPAMLTVGGLFDAEDCFGAWASYKAIEKQSPATNNKVVMGPWFHGQWNRGNGSYLGNIRFGSNTAEYYTKNIEIPFFNYYLKGKGNVDFIKEANIFFTGANEWKHLESWPIKDLTELSFYFHDNGKLDNNLPSASESLSAYISDPNHPVPYTEDVHLSRTREYMTDDQRFASRRPDVLTFSTEILGNDLTLAGPILADLQTMISTTDADFVVKVIDVFPNDFQYQSVTNTPEPKTEMAGYQMLVRGEIFRGKFRNSFEKPEPFVVGKTEQVKFALPDIAHTFKKGHKLMIQVQSSWFPLFDRNPQQFVNIYTCDEKDFVKSEIKILHNASAASKITFSVVK
jgi:uncharacterized protein